MPAELRRFVQRALAVADDEVFLVERIAVAALGELSQLLPSIGRTSNSCRTIRASGADPRSRRGLLLPRSGRRTLIVHHPYESFDVVVPFEQQAARDPDVVAIKQTLYRTSKRRSPDRARARGGRRGRQVGDGAGGAESALRRGGQHPLGARPRARRRAGGHRDGYFERKTPFQAVAGGAPRRWGAVSYVHVGTGNYHPVTARIYTDLSFFTADPVIARDVARIFNFVTGYAEPAELEKMAVSPLTLRKRICEHIEEEIAHAKNGGRRRSG